MKYSIHLTLMLKLAILSLFIGFTFFAGAQTAAAACPEDPDFFLTVNGGCEATIVNGDDVELAWYINKDVTACTINNGIGNIDVSGPLPISGSMDHTPPEDSSTPYSITCDGAVQTATVDVYPVVTMSIDGGSPKTLDPTTGRIDDVRVRWDSEYADECSPMWRTTASEPTRKYTSWRSQDNYNRLGTSGWANFDNWPNGGYVTETTTFGITCYNTFRGTETEQTIVLVVEDPEPPDDVVLNFWQEDTSVEPDYIDGYAYTRVGFNSQNASWCRYRAELADGTRYGSYAEDASSGDGTVPTDWALEKYGNDYVGWDRYGPLPSGFGAWGGHTSRTFSNVELATTTRLFVRCSRGEVTLDGVTYPSDSETKSVLIEVATGTEIIRSSLPPVTVSLSATPTNPVKNSLTGRASVDLTVIPENAEYCHRTAYRYDSGTGAYDDRYDVNDWSRWNTVGDRPSGYVKQAQIATTTRFLVRCYRSYDLTYGDATEQAEAYAESETLITPLEAPVAAPPPVAYLYGNAVRWDSSDILANATVNNGFIDEGISAALGNDVMRTPNGFTGTADITFPFTHPHGASDDYDIHAQFCDETDGVSTFEVVTERSGVVATWTTNDPDAGHQYCRTESLERERVAQSINIEDGEEVTVRCTKAVDDPEPCRLDRLWFGAGNGSSIVVPIDPNIGFTYTNVQWISDNTTQCRRESKIAAPLGGSTYRYANNDNTGGNVDVLISTTTEFDISCSRSGDTLTDSSNMQVVVPTSFTLSSESLVSSGECWYNGLPTELPYSIGETIDAPDGYIADTSDGSPNPGACIPSVDLAAISPSVNVGGPGVVTDNVAGTYDGIDVLMAIENLGPGDLPTNSNISYAAEMILPQYTLATVTSAIGFFNGDIPAPPPVSTSPSLTRTMDPVPFGSHTACARVNVDNSPNNYPEASTDFGNNINCTSVTLPVPRPPMNLVPDRTLIRSGQQITLNWDAHTSYSTECEVRGPGGVNVTFDADGNYPSPPGAGGATTGSITTDPLTSTAEFTLTCTEDEITGTVHEPERVTVEVVPESQEI